jgi:hypothetical protein
MALNATVEAQLEEQSTGDHDVDHSFCVSCYEEGARQGLCGTPMRPDAVITDDDSEPESPCPVCYSPDITCNLCGRVFP